MNFLEYINGILEEILQDFYSGTGQYIGAAKLIAGLGVTISAFFMYFRIMGGEGLDRKGIGKIIAVLLGITFYGTFLQIINTPLDIASNSIKTIAQSEDGNTENYFNTYDLNNNNGSFGNDPEKDKLIKEKLNEADQSLGISSDEGGGIMELSKNIYDTFAGNAFDNVKLWIIEGFYNIVHWIGNIAIIILNLIRTFFLVVLASFGIFAIAFSAYPGLENSFFQWLQKYINVYLWLPISYILQGLISRLFTYIKAEAPINSLEMITSSRDEMMMGVDNSIMGMLGLCAVVSFATVPTLSSWLVNAATNGMSSKLKGKTMDGAKQMASKGAAVASGGKTAAVQGGLQAVKQK